MIFNPADPTWINRDRILIGVKDISPLYYATLSMFGYDITIDDLKRYDEFDPEVGQNLKKNVSKGIENRNVPFCEVVMVPVKLVSV